MNMWLYQLNAKLWSPGVFRYEVSETQRWSWGCGKKIGKSTPAVGDTVVFFYSKTDCSDPGIYGWAIIERFDPVSKTLYFIPTAPTNWLKMDPWWDDEAILVCEKIRGNMKQATLFPIRSALIPRIRKGIRKWLKG